MNEKQWTYLIEELLNNSDLGENIKVKPFVNVPYAREITSYDSNFNELESNTAPYETDILVYEEIKGVIKPRVIIELKVSSVTTHDAITYSDKAQLHKNVTPYIRYGIAIGDRKHYPLPGRLFRHGLNFDFMISFKDFKLTPEETNTFVDLLKHEINASIQIEEMLADSRKSTRKKYYMLHKKLDLKEFD